MKSNSSMNGRKRPIIENQTWRTTGGMKPLPLIALLFWSFSQARGTEDNDTFLLAEKFRLNGIRRKRHSGKLTNRRFRPPFD